MRGRFLFVLFAVAGWFTFRVVAALSDEPSGQYREPFARSWPIRERQHLQMKAYLDGLSRRAEPTAEISFPLDFTSTAAYESSLGPIRPRMNELAGFPPPRANENPVPRFEFVAEDQVARIYRVWTEIFQGVEAYAIYMVPRVLSGKAPLLVAIHGGSGCPEAICDLDTRVNYRSFGREAVKRGYIVYAPGLLMAVTYADPPDPRIEGADYRSLDRQAADLGTSTRDLQIYQIIAGTTAVLKARPEADAERIGMTGLSMGGGYTLAAMSLWPAVKAGVCSAGFQVPESEALPGAATDTLRASRRISRPESVALICPRPLMIQSGEQDTVVPLEGARRGVPHARGYYERLGVADRFEFNVHPGGHVFENEAIFRFFDEHLRKDSAE